jgi:hypothetical protein
MGSRTTWLSDVTTAAARVVAMPCKHYNSFIALHVSNGQKNSHKVDADINLHFSPMFNTKQTARSISGTAECGLMPYTLQAGEPQVSRCLRLPTYFRPHSRCRMNLQTHMGGVFPASGGDELEHSDGSNPGPGACTAILLHTSHPKKKTKPSQKACIPHSPGNMLEPYIAATAFEQVGVISKSLLAL